MSASTVPLQCRWFLNTSGVRKGPLVSVNQSLLVASFLVCRVALVPYAAWVYSVSLGIGFRQLPLVVPLMFLCGGILLMAFNIAWLVTLLRHPPGKKPMSESRKQL